MSEGVDKQAFKRGIDSEEILERVATTHFSSIFRNIDQTLFAEDGVHYSQGFRNKDVRFLDYLAAPVHENVPKLMGDFFDKVTEFQYHITFSRNPDNRLAFSAWALWMILMTHPKNDGNGRLAKAVAEFISPRNELMFYKSDHWKKGLSQTREDIVREVSQRSKKDVPQIFSDSITKAVINVYDLEAEMRGFYNPAGHDLVTDIIRDGIKQTTITPEGIFTAGGPSEKALDLFKQFIQSSPKREKYIYKPKIGWKQVIKRLMRRSS